MAEPFVGQIVIFGGNFAPSGWAFCQGQILPIAPYTALFSLIGVTYGGNGVNTFALPDLRGRTPIGFSQGPGLSNYVLGQASGSETNTLLQSNLPPHVHGVSTPVSASPGTTSNPSQAWISTPTVTVSVHGTTATVDGFASNPTTSATLATYPTSMVGNGIAVNNLQPYLAVNYIIALDGTFPSRG